MAERPPSRNIDRLARSLFADRERQEILIEALFKGESEAPALLWLAERPVEAPFVSQPRTSWQPEFVDLIDSGQRPGAHPLHQAGAYYCLDFSSVFEASLVRHCLDVSSILDVCAAPGGKSVFAYRALAPARLVSNEVIGKRRGALVSNLKRCAVDVATVTGIDSARLKSSLAETFCLVIVDAPCSGQSLEAKGSSAEGAFHPVTINMNANRQKRIVANSLQLVRPGGYLAYMTCTFSPKENEGVVEWVRKKFPEFVTVACETLAGFQSELSSEHCYRLFPFQGMGAGGFCSLFRRQH